MKTLTVLGSTGSIGENTLNVARALPNEYIITGLAANKNVHRVLEQAKEFHVSTVAFTDCAAAAEAKAAAPELTVLSGPDGVADLARISPTLKADNHIVVCAIVGMAALNPVMTAVSAGFDIAIATKEVLVAAGETVCRECEKNKVRLLPVDSEHCAIFQSLQDTVRVPWCVRRREFLQKPASEDAIRRLILTASGGPFADRPDFNPENITVEEALNHPRWKMGPKVTIDSATMMNKGLEILEAKWLFNIPADRISVLVHPQSIVHSIVEFKDAAMIAQLGMPDMRIAIQYALSWPERPENLTLPRLDLAKAAQLTFREPDPKRFPCLDIARAAAAAGGVATAVMNAANEIAVSAFLSGKINFPGIWKTVERVLERFPNRNPSTIDDIIAADNEARVCAKEFIRTAY